MSVWRWKSRIARAVAGDLSVAEDARLRRHLGTCRACRDLYDDLVATAEGLVQRGRGDGTRHAAEREARRLREALTPRPTARPRRVMVWGSLAALPAAALVFVVVKVRTPRTASVTEPPAGVVWRGGAATEGPPASLPTVLLFASRNLGDGRHGPVRMVGEIPGSGEATVTTADFLQLAVRNLRRTTWPAVLARTESGDVRVLWPSAGREGRLDPGGKETLPLGPSLDLAASGLTGKLTLCVLLADVPPTPRELWPKACDGAGGTAAVHGLLLVTPAS
jgi:hypothetical protein